MIDPEARVPEPKPTSAQDRSPTPKAPPADEEDEDVDEEPEETQPDEEDDDEELDDAPAPAPKRKLKVGEDEVDEEEVVKGYLRQSDYTRKTQALAEQRKKFESEDLPKVRAAEQQYAERLQELETAIKAVTPQEPDWDTLRKEHPEEFPRILGEWQVHERRMQKLADARKEADAKVAENQRLQAEAASAAAAERLLELIPDWKTEATMKADAQAIVKLVEPLGITKQELAGMQRPELYVILRKAAQFDALQADIQAGKVPASKKAPKSPTDLPATARTDERGTPVKEFEKDFKRAARSGKPEDAASAIRHLL
ncbi:MAG TPA: hypothetical protein VFI41_12765 [Gemmatimonadales bacterium]|nr:hypothetical protein [Gemmatimonadales bacterium]